MTSAETLYTRLTSVVGEHGVWMDERQAAAFAIGACHPRAVVCPTTVPQAAEILRLAGHEHLAVVPWGRARRCIWARHRSATTWPCRWRISTRPSTMM